MVKNIQYQHPNRCFVIVSRRTIFIELSCSVFNPNQLHRAILYYNTTPIQRSKVSKAPNDKQTLDVGVFDEK
jgi:hypothetical protein